MIKSKFSFWVIVPLFAFICLFGVTISAFLNEQGLFDKSLNILIRFGIAVFFSLVCWVLFMKELVGKCITIQFDGDTIVKRKFLGLMNKEGYSQSEIDGYCIIDVPSKSGTYEYLYFVIKNRRILIVSEFYHRNYKDVKKFIMQSGIKNLGKSKWSLIEDIERSFGGN